MTEATTNIYDLIYTDREIDEFNLSKIFRKCSIVNNYINKLDKIESDTTLGYALTGLITILVLSALLILKQFTVAYIVIGASIIVAVSIYLIAKKKILRNCDEIVYANDTVYELVSDYKSVSEDEDIIDAINNVIIYTVNNMKEYGSDSFKEIVNDFVEDNEE